MTRTAHPPFFLEFFDRAGLRDRVLPLAVETLILRDDGMRKNALKKNNNKLLGFILFFNIIIQLKNVELLTFQMSR